MAQPGYLLLEDGRVFHGDLVGASSFSIGEAVFNTSMTGYQEVLTDPSYAGQIITMTYPLIGNYGVNTTDEESARVQVAGFVVREMATMYSNWRATMSLPDYLEQASVPALTGVDTRGLTRHLRSAGSMRAAIAPATQSVEDTMARIQAHPLMEGLDLATDVSTDAPYHTKATGPKRFHVVAYDFGIKRNSQRLLSDLGCDITTVPATTKPEEIVALKPDGLFISNGPGDPEAVPHALETIRRLANDKVPVFGICLGHQLIARAFGGHTYKLLYGHRAGNHPVKRLEDDVVEITAQNHGFAVRREGETGVEGAPDLKVTHVNLNDGTMEGLEHRTLPVFSVQYHPEAAPGPHDSRYLFDRFVGRMLASQGKT
ncbi:MAG: glutamine-hydrolyzing carbamoyl-phosphate synthase small subunit [Longimicrobiales bacterium]